MSAEPALRPVVKQFLQFAVVGGVGTVSHYIVLAALVELAHVSVLPSTTAGAITGALVNYALSRRYIFISDAKHVIALPKFLTVAGLGALINALVVGWMLEYSNLHYLVVQLFATGTVLVWNFAVNATWTFKA